MDKQKELMYWVMGVFFVWIFGSVYVYTCSIKGFCENKNNINTKIVEENITGKVVSDVNNVDNFNNYNNYISLNNNIKKNNNVVAEDLVVQSTETVKEYKRRVIKCYTHINSIIKINSEKNIKSEVEKLENFFNDYYKKDLVVDGFFGEKEMEAVKEFQRNKNLDDDGVVGPKTLEIINAVYCVKNENK